MVLLLLPARVAGLILLHVMPRRKWQREVSRGMATGYGPAQFPRLALSCQTSLCSSPRGRQVKKSGHKCLGLRGWEHAQDLRGYAAWRLLSFLFCMALCTTHFAQHVWRATGMVTCGARVKQVTVIEMCWFTPYAWLCLAPDIRWAWQR